MYPKQHRWEIAAYECLSAAAFEERVNKDREGADWWRSRASLWFRRAHEAGNAFVVHATTGENNAS